MTLCALLLKNFKTPYGNTEFWVTWICIPRLWSLLYNFRINYLLGTFRCELSFAATTLATHWPKFSCLSQNIYKDGYYWCFLFKTKVGGERNRSENNSWTVKSTHTLAIWWLEYQQPYRPHNLRSRAKMVLRKKLCMYMESPWQNQLGWSWHDFIE